MNPLNRTLSPDELDQTSILPMAEWERSDRRFSVGENLLWKDRRWRVVADFYNQKSLKKFFDYIIISDNGDERRVWQKDLEDATKLIPALNGIE